MHNFLVPSNERACRKSGRLGMDQVIDLSKKERGYSKTRANNK